MNKRTRNTVTTVSLLFRYANEVNPYPCEMIFPPDDEVMKAAGLQGFEFREEDALLRIIEEWAELKRAHRQAQEAAAMYAEQNTSIA